MLASTASESPEKTIYESQLPLSSWTEQHQRTERLVLDAYSLSYSQWNAEKNWSCQERKSDELMEVRTGGPVFEQPSGLFTQHTDRFIVDDDEIDSDTFAESDMSLKSRSFLHRVLLIECERCKTNPQKMQQRQTFFTIENVYVFDISSICIHGKDYSDNGHSIKNSEDLTMKQMFDISEKLMAERSDEIYGVNTINRVSLHGTYFFY